MDNFYLEHNLPKPELPTCPIIQTLKGQKCLVTGASSGIGKAIAIAIAHAGADVMVNYAGNEKAAEITADLADNCGSKAVSDKADVSIEDEVEAMFAKFVETFGRLDILVSNAGIQRDAPFDQMTLDQWNQVIGTNLTGQFLCARSAVRLFKKQGVPSGLSVAAGKIICISSVHDIIPWAGHVNYASSKGGVMLMMKSLAQEVAPHRIRVNSISPGAIRTPINKEAWSTPEAYKDLMKLIPYKRIGEPEEIGRAAVWLASDDSDYINGATVYVDGGMTLYPGFESGG
ncbi:MAG: SDR family oxidoreductase [Candidatus Caenarcaniphilales bacterium]|nr:SDR family oxidoreductase [Candidatus Caenarcaniphilales bacterium]